MTKHILDLIVTENILLHKNYCLLKLTDSKPLPPMLPGQFVQIKVEDSPGTFLRRPISVNFVDKEKNELWLLIQFVGEGTQHLGRLKKGDSLNIMLPLGNSFTIPTEQNEGKLLLIGGGVGTAPMLFMGACLREAGFTPSFLLGARSKDDLLQLDIFESLGDVYVTTEDGSMGEKGFVTNHSILDQKIDNIYTCGPKPMMMAVAKYARQKDINCEVSLENMMACGIGACLCCVEKDNENHHVCVCTEGPVFNINKLSWQI